MAATHNSIIQCFGPLKKERITKKEDTEMLNHPQIHEYKAKVSIFNGNGRITKNRRVQMRKIHFIFLSLLNF